MKFGVLILNSMIDNDYLILEREPFFTFEEIMEDKVKKTLRLQPYHLELGFRFHDIEIDARVRNGISLRHFPKWEEPTRLIEGVMDRMIKSSVIEIDKKAPFVQAINHLEGVKWCINPLVAEVSKSLVEELIDTTIILDNDVEFDTRDIRCENLNKHLKGQKLCTKMDLYSTLVKAVQERFRRLKIRLTSMKAKLKKLKVGGKIHTNIKAELARAYKKFEKHNLNWLAKQICLSTQSKALRDSAILNTMHGENGWGNFNFYLSMFLDFRGRVYARDAFFSYQSSDLARGHLMFAEQKVMTERGYEHLSVHIANSYNQTYEQKDLRGLNWLTEDYLTDLIEDDIPGISVDKMSRTDRIQWTDEHLELFRAIADDPIGHSKIWRNAEKPWVFLSLCFELVSFWRSIAEGEEYLSQIPIAIDGSSNGTQHLAAMSKDEVAGRMVGLIPMDKPIDFYIVVAKGIINRNVGTDLGALLAKIPMKLMRKGISKRGTMTKAYDAGVKCIADIIYKDCYDAGMTKKYGITKSIAKKLSKDLVDTYNAICYGPVEIKNYLQALVHHQMDETEATQIEWWTPSDFHVISEKYISRKHKVNLPFTQGVICAVIREFTDMPATHELVSGISPNWVHSMDASHMSLVINSLNELGITSFGAIHDSFSVHAEDIDDLLYVTKDIFIDMYEGDVFKEMKEQLVGLYSTFMEEPPKEGNLDLSKVMGSDYFFS